MEMLYIAGFALAAAAITVTVKNFNKEIGMLTAVGVCVVIILAILPTMRQLINSLLVISTKAALNEAKLGPLLKATGVAIVTEISADLCRDNGESAMAKQVELAGKILILIIALPLAQEILEIFAGLLGQ
jgi:stage III sporulation protein AD